MTGASSAYKILNTTDLRISTTDRVKRWISPIHMIKEADMAKIRCMLVAPYSEEIALTRATPIAGA